MNYGICVVSVVPVRAEPSDREEMVTQLLFGEKVEIFATQSKWLNIKAKYDGYEGWIDPKVIVPISELEFKKESAQIYASELYNLMIVNDLPLTLTIGAHLPNLQKNTLQINETTFEYLGEFADAKQNKLSLADIAELYINTPYLWGGKSSFGIDCSGLVQQVFKLKNIWLPRDASQQAEHGEVLSFIEEANSGDLAFFDNEEGKIIHVGIITENQKIIHAHGKVRIDPIDSTGIFNTDSQSYSHKLRFIKRMV